MPISTRMRALGAKVEAALGTAESLTNAAMVMNVTDMDHTDNTDFTPVQRQSGFGQALGFAGARMGSMNFSMFMVGKGTTGLPYWANLLTGCGGAFAAQVFSPLRDNPTGLTAAIYRGSSTTAIYQSLYGAMGNAVLTFNAGKVSPVKFSLTGCASPESAVTLPTVTQDTVIPPRCTGAAITIGGYEILCDTVEFDMGNTVIMRQAVGASGLSAGYISAWITNRAPRVRITPEADLLSNKDWSNLFNSSTTGALVCTLGTATNNILTLAAPALQLVKPPGNGDRNGLWTRSLEFSCNQSGDTEDDDYTITFS